jgi:hypothetical protein
MKSAVTSKIEVLREIQKELETKKAWRSFFNDEFISVDYDVNNRVIFANWKGYQTESTIKQGCEKILYAMMQFRCRRVLNNNSNVIGIWIPAATWLATDWFPRAITAGLSKFAWIYSPAASSRNFIDEILKLTAHTQIIRTFREVPAGIAWLAQ